MTDPSQPPSGEPKSRLPSSPAVPQLEGRTGPFWDAFRAALPEIEELLKGTNDIPDPPLTREKLTSLLAIQPPSSALERVIGALPLPLNPWRRRNELLRDLNLAGALSLSINVEHGLGLIIDYGTGEEYDALVDLASRLGATHVRDYLVAGRDACGGSIPVEEMARAELSERFDPELRVLDLKYRGLIEEELETALVRELGADVDRSVARLNEILLPAQ